MSINTANEVRAALLAKGYSLSSWAIEHGHQPRMVQKCVLWFAPETGRKPKRPKSRLIMEQIGVTLGVDLLGVDDE